MQTGSPAATDAADEQAVAEAADADLTLDDDAYVAPTDDAGAGAAVSDDTAGDDADLSPSDAEYLQMESMQGDGELPIDMGHQPADTSADAVTTDDAATSADAAPNDGPEAPAAPTSTETDAVEVPEATSVAGVEDEPVVEEPVVEEPADTDGDPFRGPGDWYVVHTYAGYENKVKANLESRIHTMQMEDKIFRVHIPMEDVMEIKSGKKQVVQKKVFPGYLLVKMYYDNDSWYVVRNTPGVTGFVSAGTGSKPTPLSKREVEKILVVKKEEAKPQVRLGFEEGDVVRITSGPFADFNGTISEINPDQAKLKVLVNIFDRETPVELSFDQVAKV